MSWPMVELGSVVSFIGGSQPPKSEFKYEAQDGYVRLLQIRDYKSDDNLTYIPSKSTKKFCSKDDVMIGRYGPPVFQILRGLEGAYNVALMKAQPSELVDRDYLYYFLKQEKLFRLIDGLSQRTAGQSGVDMDALKAYPMLLPPLAEQKRIAAILDKADAIRRKRQQAIQLADDFLRAVFLEMFGDPVTNPKGWEVKMFSELVENKDGKRVPIKSSDRRLMSGDFPYYGASGVIDFVNDFIFEGRNLLIGEDGANLLARSTPVAFIADGKYWVNNHAHVLGEKTVKLEYLQYTINLRTLEPYISGSAQPKLNQANLNSIPIPVPPTALSNKFAQIVTETLNLISKMNDFGGFRDFEALSQKAFSGQL